jgi:hypothetical protein
MSLPQLVMPLSGWVFWFVCSLSVIQYFSLQLFYKQHLFIHVLPELMQKVLEVKESECLRELYMLLGGGGGGGHSDSKFESVPVLSIRHDHNTNLCHLLHNR